MRTTAAASLALLLALGFPVLSRGEPAPASIVRLELPDEQTELRPVTLPTEPGNTLELDFPWPLEDWAGRGFTPDPERYAGDFVIEAARGSTRAFVTAVAPDAHRVLHVVLGPPGAPTRSVTLEFIPAPPALSWKKAVFQAPGPAGAPFPPVVLADRPPEATLRQAGAEAELGLLRTLRLMLALPAQGAHAVADANPALELVELHPTPASFGDFTLAPRFALRDSTTGLLGVCVGVANATNRRLSLDPASWVLRVGDHVYPVGTVDFPSELGPGTSSPALLVLSNLADGRPTRLLASNTFEPSARLLGKASARPVHRYEIEDSIAQ